MLGVQKYFEKLGEMVVVSFYKRAIFTSGGEEERL